MRRFFLQIELQTNSHIKITGQDAHHISHVLRLKPGDTVEVASSSGQIAIAKIESVDSDQATVYVEGLKAGGAEPPVSLVLAQGLPKADKMEYIIQKAVELGVTSIVPMVCDHSVVNYDAKKAVSRVDRWQSIAREAAKQSKRDIVPTIAPIRDFKQIVADCPNDTVILMLYEGKTPLCLREALQKAPATTYLLLIGPEGGFSQAEVDFCQQRGADCVTLGPRILRTETASLAAISIILYECGDLGGVPCRA